MITRDTKDCVNPFKHHLFRLPDIPIDRQPESYDYTNDAMLALIPLFQTRPYPRDVSLEHHLVRSACWARRSWILFSDAVGLGIQFGFYVGDKTLDRIEPILKANGIDIDTDIFLLHESPFEGDPVTHLGKKLSVFNDKQFADYDWVFQIDSDLFLSSPSRKQGRFFSPFRFAPFEIGSVRTNVYHKNVISDLHWHHRILDDTRTMDQKASEWLKRAKSLIGDAVSVYAEREESFPICHGGIYAFPAKHFHEDEKETCKWLADAGQLLQDDEAVFSIYMLKNHQRLFDIEKELGIPFCVDLHRLKERRAAADPIYFSHIGDLHEEWLWRDDFDGL